MSELHPALILLAGGLFLFCLPSTPRRIVSVCLPVLGFLNLLTIADGTLWHITWGGYELTVLRADRFGMLFGYLFHLAAFPRRNLRPASQGSTANRHGIDLRGIGGWRSICRRSDHPVHLLGIAGDHIGIPDMGARR